MIMAVTGIKMSGRGPSFNFGYFIAIVIRFVLVHSSFRTSIHDRVEVSTPLNSWKKLLEGVYLYNEGVDPYTGDLFHQTPLMLHFFRILISYIGPWLELLFIATDLVTAYLLYQVACSYASVVKREEDRKNHSGEFCKQSENLLLTERDVSDTPTYVLYAYLFNPYVVLNCVGLTTTVFANFMMASVFYTLVRRHKILCIALLALISLESLYPVLLLVPICLQWYNPKTPKQSLAGIISLYVLILLSLLLSCYYISGNWLFLDAIYGFILNVHDLTPNIGLFWYFFTEMFEHFRALFISALQINATILYLAPLSLYLKDEPIFLSMILTALTAIFKSYPCLGDVGFYLALVPMWKHLFVFMPQSFIVGCILVITSVLGPTVWHLWIYAGSANANFFFGVTLAFATAQIFLITDLLFAHQKRKFALKYGWPDNSSKATLILD